jgi:hypothetical protein
MPMFLVAKHANNKTNHKFCDCEQNSRNSCLEKAIGPDSVLSANFGQKLTLKKSTSAGPHDHHPDDVVRREGVDAGADFMKLAFRPKSLSDTFLFLKTHQPITKEKRFFTLY